MEVIIVVTITRSRCVSILLLRKQRERGRVRHFLANLYLLFWALIGGKGHCIFASLSCHLCILLWAVISYWRSRICSQGLIDVTTKLCNGFCTKSPLFRVSSALYIVHVIHEKHYHV